MEQQLISQNDGPDMSIIIFDNMKNHTPYALAAS